jgi:hypothetical protein
MKKRSILMSIFILTFSLSVLFSASVAKAETAKGTAKNLASILNLKAASLTEQKSTPPAATARASKALKQVCVSLNQGLDAFLDLKSPYPQHEIRTKNSRDDIRAVIGFHFMIR